MVKIVKLSLILIILLIPVQTFTNVTVIATSSQSIHFNPHTNVSSKNNGQNYQYLSPKLQSNQFFTTNTVNVSSKEITGPVPVALNGSVHSVKLPMYYSVGTSYNLSLFTNHDFHFSQPVNVTINGTNSPLNYGINFDSYNSLLQVDNTTLTSYNASAISNYSYNDNNGSNYIFSSFGSGGSIWSNFSIASFNGKKILNPFSSKLIFNMSGTFSDAILPNDGMLYTYYIDFKFQSNSSIINTPFPSIFRIYLLYSQNYADRTLFNVNSNANFWYYVNGNSNINLLLKNSSISSKEISLNISAIFSQIINEMNLTSIIPYFNTFQGIEIGFFSSNSTTFRKVTLKIHNFSLYNIFNPLNWLDASGEAATINGKETIDNSFLSNPISLQNCYDITVLLKFNPGYSIDQTLFFTTAVIKVSINFNYLAILSYSGQLIPNNLLKWKSQITNFPLYSLDNLEINSTNFYTFRQLLYYIPKTWLPYSLPTVQNNHFHSNYSGDLLSTSYEFASNVWFGGLVPSNFSSSAFQISFYSKNAFSLFSIHAFIKDNVLNINFNSKQNLKLAKSVVLYENNSNVYKSIETYVITSLNDTSFLLQDSINIKFNLEGNYLLFLRSNDITDGYLLQSFSFDNILKDFNDIYSCSFHSNTTQDFPIKNVNFTLNCFFNSNFYSESFLSNLIIYIRAFNSTFIFQFDKIYSQENSMLFKKIILFPSSKNDINESVMFNYSVIALVTGKQEILWSNSSLIMFYPISTPVLYNSDLYGAWPFYLGFSSLILSILVIRKRKAKSIVKNQLS